MMIEIKQIIDHGRSIDREVEWLKCATSDNQNIIFWGSLGGKNRNIAALKDQLTPFSIEIESPEECSPSKFDRELYNAILSVPEDVRVLIDPTR